MDRHLTRLSEHLACVALSKLAADKALECEEASLANYGPVSVVSFSSPVEAVNYLLPLKSFNRRFLIWPAGEWSFICSDMIGEWRMVDVYAHSRATNCEAVAGVALPGNRRFCYINRGKILRELCCEEDGDRWVFEQDGPPLDFEETDQYGKRIKRMRLTPRMVDSMLRHVTGTTSAAEALCSSSRIYGLERSWKDLRGEVEEFSIQEDLF